MQEEGRCEGEQFGLTCLVTGDAALTVLAEIIAGL
jgi:hypothetical protein